MGTHSINWDRAQNQLSFTLSGTFAADEWRRWNQALRQQIQQVPSSGWTLLADITDFPAQSQEIQKGIEDQMRLIANSGCTKIAMVAPPAITAMLTKRLANATGAPALFE